jgi:hypothetical protein
LKRVSAVAICVMALSLAIIGIGENEGKTLAIVGFPIACAVVGFICYKTVCWLIDGFADKSAR